MLPAKKADQSQQPFSFFPKKDNRQHVHIKKTGDQQTAAAAQEQASDLVDPAILQADYGSCLIVGKSGTGKTSLLQSIVERQLKRPNMKRLFVYNDRDAQYKVGKTLSSLADLPHVPRNSIVILEDVIALKKKEEEVVRSLLNFYCHHHSLIAYVVTHHVHRTSLLGMLPFFHYLIFTNHRSNGPLIKLCLAHFHIEKPKVEKALEKFQSEVDSSPGYGSYFVFDCKRFDFYGAPSFEALERGGAESLKLLVGESAQLDRQTSQGEPDHVGESEKPSGRSGEATDKLVEKFKFFSGSIDRPQEAQFLLKMILNCLPPRLVRLHDLTFEFQRKDGEADRVSIVDYVVSLLDERSPPVNKKLLFFHHYLSKHCCVPSFAQKNKNFSKKI